MRPLPMPGRCAVVLALAGGLSLAVPATAAAQEPGTVGLDPPPSLADVPSSTLLSRVRSPRLSIDEAELLVAELRLRPTRARLTASDALCATYGKRQKACDQAYDRLRERCERAAARAQKLRLDRAGGDQVQAARAAALAVTRGNDLTKERIHSDIDPRIDELRAILLPTRDDLFDADTDLRAAVDELRAQHAELARFFAAYAGVTADMEGNEDVDRHFAKHPMPAGPEGPDAIDTMLDRAAFEGLPMAEQDKKALLANDELRAGYDAEEFAGTLALNRLRYLLGLGLLRIDPKLGDAARDHAADMDRLHFFDHKSPVPGKETFGKRAANFGTSASAENIAAGHDSGEGAIRGWWYSPGHHKNMLGGHRRTGLGRHGQLWTQMFGG